MTATDDKAAAGRGHLRAAHADREQVIEVLKVAFVQGRLTEDELEARTARTLASKTYAELDALTADIPTSPADIAAVAAGVSGASVGSSAARSAVEAGTTSRTLGRAARRSAVCLLVAVALTEGAFLTNTGFFLVLAFFAFMAASCFVGYGVIDARQQRRSRAQPPSRPGQDGRGRRDGRAGCASRPGPDPAPPGSRTDHARADLRAHRARASRPRHPSRPAVPPPLPHSNTYRGVFRHRGVYWVLRSCRSLSRWRAWPERAHHLSLLPQRGLPWTATSF